MKLYSFPGAPNPRRVLIFAAEKNIALDIVNVDLMGGEIKKPEFLAKNPSGKIPVLELEDGTCIAESVAISRYLEALNPEPNLFGVTALETALIEMHHRHIEMELHTAIGAAWVNGPVVASMGIIKPIEAMRERGDRNARSYYERLDRELASRDYIAGDRFTVADISATCMIDFAGAMVNLEPEASLVNLKAWRDRIGERASVMANPTSG